MDIELVAMQEDDILYLVDGEKTAWQFWDDDFEYVTSPLAWNASDYKAAIREPNVRGHSIMAGNFCVGAILWEPETERFLIHHLFVCPPFRKAGMGRQAIGFLHDKLQQSKNPDRTIEAYIHENDTASCRFFARLGFESRLVRGFWGDADAVHFVFPCES